MRILVVDDDPMAGELAAAVLEEAGHQCLVAENGVAALELLALHPELDLVVSDMNMPLIGGLDLLRELREQGRATPFVLLTGEDPGPLRERHPGLAGVLAKDGTLEDALPALVAGIRARAPTA
jgi:CheY-like chemotaxis protein